MTNLSIVEAGKQHLEGPGGAVEPRWNRLWYSTVETPWNSIAIIPTDPGISSEQVARGLVEVGRLYSAKPIDFVNAIGIGGANVDAMIAQIAKVTSRGEAVVVAFDSIIENPAAIQIIRTMSAAVVVVKTGLSRLASARRIVDAVGRERLRGSFVLD